MNPYFTNCFAYIDYPVEVLRHLNRHFGDELSGSNTIEFAVDFGLLVQVGDIIVLDNSDEQSIANVAYIKKFSWVVDRTITYLSEYMYTSYLVTVREFGGDSICLRIELQPSPLFNEFTF